METLLTKILEIWPKDHYLFEKIGESTPFWAAYLYIKYVKKRLPKDIHNAIIMYSYEYPDQKEIKIYLVQYRINEIEFRRSIRLPKNLRDNSHE